MMPIVFVPTSVIKVRSQISQQIQPEEEVRLEESHLSRANHVERFFNRLKQFRYRYPIEKLGATS